MHSAELAIPVSAPRTATSGVFVIGMHRSGTSAVTRVVNMLGVPVCRPSDLVRELHGNPKGHWESATLVRLNNRLLHQMGYAWWCPPPPGPDDGAFARITMPIARARAQFETQHPTREWACKDPRTSLTLPFWLEALNVLPAVILVHRNPLEVADSLKRRNGFDHPLSLALWERYVRSALAHAHGLPVLVTQYVDLLRDPESWCASTCEFLRDIDMSTTEVDQARVREFLDTDLRHSRSSYGELAQHEAAGRTLLPVYSALQELTGAWQSFVAPSLPREAPRVQRVFDELRRKHGLPGEASKRRRRGTRAISMIVTGPGGGPAAQEDVERLEAALPAGGHLVVADPPPGEPSLGRARNAGARTAAGDVLVFAESDVHVTPRALGLLADAVASGRAHACVPAVSTVGSRAGAGFGMTFTDRLLSVAWLPRSRQDTHVVPLLPGCLLAVRARAFAAIGGFDDGMGRHGLEDVEFSMRLWRSGRRCVVVPPARAERAERGDEVDAVSFLSDLLRLGVLHLGHGDLARLIEALSGYPAFAPAAAAVGKSDAAELRARTEAMCERDDQWFFDRFGIAPWTPAQRERVA